MKGITLIIIFVCSLLSPVLVSAQNNRAEQIQTMKIAYLTRQLALTPDEAAAFWPVYNALADELEANRKELKQMEGKLRQAYMQDNSSELESMVDTYVQTKANEAEIVLEYHEKLKRVLPIRKVVQLYKAEEEFKKRILNTLRNRQQGAQGRRRSGINNKNEE